MINQKKLKSKLKRGIILIVLVFLLIAGVGSYYFSENQIKEKFSNEAKGVMNYTHLILTNTFKDAELGIQMIEKDFLNNNADASFLSLIYESIPQSSTVFIGDEEGNFLLYPLRFVPSDYDPRKRQWYIDAIVNEGEMSWSEPYIDIGTQELTITASKKMVINNKVIAVAGVDILLNELKLAVENAIIGENGYVVIVNNSGTMLSHPDKSLIGLQWSDVKEYDVSIEDVLKGSEFFYPIKKFDKGNLTIISIISKKDFFSEFINLYGILMIITLVFLIILERFAVTFSNKIVNPILDLKRTMEVVKNGNYSARCDVKSDDEIGFLVDGFNEMVQSVYETSFEMQALYEELYASEETLQEQYDALYENKEFIKKNEERYKSIFEASKEGLWEMDSNYLMHFLTPSWYDQFEVGNATTQYNKWLELIHPEDRVLTDLIVKDHIDNHTERYHCEYRVLNKSEEYIWIESIGKARFDEDGNFKSMTGSHLDISIRKNYELKIFKMAYKDSLTHVFNRSYFEEFIKGHLSENGKGAILFIDINNFKYINDVYGHSIGDSVLVELADRLVALFKDNKKYLLARFSGDEFIILVKDLIDKESIYFVVNSLVKEIQRTMIVRNTEFKITASVGITIFPKDGSSFHTLMQNADIAMYHAKRISKGAFHFYDENIKVNAVNEMEVENQLRKGIDENEFEVYYQPIIDVVSNKVESFEALVRWNSKQLGFVTPDRFIYIAERTGLISQIGLIVLEKSCEFIVALNSRLGKEYSISINISPIQLLDEQFTQRVVSIINTFNVPYHLINLEITESMALDANEGIIEKLFYLNNLQIGISLDDFGTGYSTFKNLIRLPLTNIKIDRSIIQDAISNVHVFKLLESIVQFAHKINIKVVAEGIENSDYLEMSKSIKVDFVQGYYYSKPVKEGDIYSTITGIDSDERAK